MNELQNKPFKKSFDGKTELEKRKEELKERISDARIIKKRYDNYFCRFCKEHPEDCFCNDKAKLELKGIEFAEKEFLKMIDVWYDKLSYGTIVLSDRNIVAEWKVANIADIEKLKQQLSDNPLPKALTEKQ